MEKTEARPGSHLLRWLTVASVALFVASASASLYVATLRSDANATLRALDQRREALGREENALRADIGSITSGQAMEARAKRLGFTAIAPSSSLSITANTR